ncbi:hypothetical protein C7T86_20295 [Xanthomonas citri pv. malvacearum]|uniref:DUF4926 domain-containing protein n=1 Tax=Xanthomonas campestris pv. malvacearum TaxID=86040 RepID=A0AA44YZW2_XANCM|nr:hypothetical protein CIW72_01795 [Xanthomonas citri pv. malvacearum]PUE90633.1 hypothetical protein C7T86_20295 [Xanthomonas citri pv. malvacearum]
MRISEFDLVRVIANIPDARIDHDFSQRSPQIGDLGAVVVVHAVQPGREAAFAVECVGSEGHTIWLADIFTSELERAPPT